LTDPPVDRRPVAAVFMIALAALFVLGGYELLRSSTSSIFQQFYQSSNIPAATILSPLSVIVVIWVYGRLLTRLGPSGALTASSLLSGLVIGGCYLGIRAGFGPAAAVLYIFRKGYIVLLIEQYWSFINSVLTPAQARRYNGPVCGLASLGAIVGGLLVRHLAEPLGTEQLVLAAALSLAPAALCSARGYRLGGEPRPSATELGGRQGTLALKLFVEQPYLLRIAVLIWLTQVVSTVFEFRFYDLAEQAFADQDRRTAFYGGFWATVNTVAAVLQFVLAPLVMAKVRLRRVHEALPAVHLLTAAGLLLAPSLMMGAGALLGFKTCDYSVFRAAKEIFYLPLSFDARYRSKQVIDSFGYRFGEGSVGAIVTALTKGLSLAPATLYPILALLAAGGWAALVSGLTAEHERLEAGMEQPPHTPTPLPSGEVGEAG